MGFESEARGSRRNKQPSPVLVRQTNKRMARTKTNFGVSFHQLTVEEGRKPLAPAVANSHSKGGARPPLDFLNYTQEQQGTLTKRTNTLIPKEVLNVPTVAKFEGLRPANSNSKEAQRAFKHTHSQIFIRNFRLSITLLLSFISSHHIPLLYCHSPSTVRERLCLL